MEPELEVHSVEDDGQESSDEENSSGRATGMPSIVLNESGESTTMMVQDHESPECSNFFESGLDYVSFELNSTFAWSDDNEDVSAPAGIRDSVLAIREEASRVNAIMALDRVDTLKQELLSMQRDMANRDQDIGALHALIQIKDTRLSTLELERDLYKADAAKLKKDCQLCLEKIRDYDHPAAQPMLMPTPDALELKHVTAGWLNGQPRIAAFKKEQGLSDLEVDYSGHAPIHSSEDLHTGAEDTQDSLTCKIHNLNQETGDTNQWHNKDSPSKQRWSPRYTTPLTRKQQQNQTSPSDHKRGTVQWEQVGVSPEDYTQELIQQLKTSMETSDKLRKRVAMISRYYEDLVRRMQEDLVALKADRARVESDLLAQIASLSYAHTSALAGLERQLQNKDSELGRSLQKDQPKLHQHSRTASALTAMNEAQRLCT